MSYSTRFDLSFSELSDLSDNLLFIQVADDALQVLATDKNRQPLSYQFIQLQEEETGKGQEINNWLQQHSGWLQQWGQVYMVHQTMQATLVPAQLFNVDNGKELIDLQFGDLFRGTILTEQVPGRQDYAVYRVPSELYNSISSAHAPILHRHLITLWICWLDKLPTVTDGQAYLLFEANRFFMAIRRSDWMLVQQFEYQTPEDPCYYLLAALESFSLTPESVQVTVDGWIDTQSALYGELNKYFRNLQVSVLPEGIRLEKEKLQDQPLHFFTPLINMAQCV